MKERSLLAPHAPILRAIIEAAGVAPLAEVAGRPGARDVFRVTAFHHDGRARDSVATLTNHLGEGPRLETVYRVTFGGKPLVHAIPPDRWTKFLMALRSVRFDRLTDQPDLPPYGVDLWLLERAAGTYAHSVIVAPALADGDYWVLASAVRMFIPDAVREVR